MGEAAHASEGGKTDQGQVRNDFDGNATFVVQTGNVSGSVVGQAHYHHYHGRPGNQFNETAAEAKFRALLAAKPPIQREGILRDWLKFADSRRGRGELAKAEAEYYAVLRAAQQLTGMYEMILTIRNNLALAVEARGELAAAETEYRAVLEDQARGPMEYGPRLNRWNLANVLRRQGKFAEAEAEYRALLNLRRRSLGEDHPGTRRTAAALDELCSDARE